MSTTPEYIANRNLLSFLTLMCSRVTVQFDKVNDTLANITGLTENVVAGRAYEFEAFLLTTSDVAAGVKVAIAGTATATLCRYQVVVLEGTAIAANGRAAALAAAVGVTAVTVAVIQIRGSIVVNAGGTLTVQFAQNVTNAAASSVLTGSLFKVQDLAESF